MIRGYKPSGYYQTATGEGYKIEGETRQCVHCGFIWQYAPGSGVTRGYCLKHQGLLCARPECAVEQRRLLRAFPHRTDLSCITMDDWNARKREQYDHDPSYKVLPSGIVVAQE